VYFVRHNGGSVWFDSLGKPWPKHSCFFDDIGAARLRVSLAEPVERGDQFFGVVTETEVTRPGEAGRIVVKCSDGRVIDREFNTPFDLTRFPGSLVVVEESEPERYRLHTVDPNANVVEVYDCPKLGQAVVFDPRRQEGASRQDTRVWLTRDKRWASFRTFHFWRIVGPVDGMTAAQIAVEYEESAPYPRMNDAGAELFDALINGRVPPGVVEVVIFADTPYERTFYLPASLTDQQVEEWIKQVEVVLSQLPVQVEEESD